MKFDVAARNFETGSDEHVDISTVAFWTPTMPTAVDSSWHAQYHYDEDAERISNMIDEGLKVLCSQLEALRIRN
jgi:ribose 1,5-bisphosphokinase PhnN